MPAPLRHAWAWLVLALVVAAALVGSGAIDLRGAQRTATPVPSPVYSIEATSGSHTASILNLGITPVGTLEVPTPVDVDGDLLPDVTVSVNLVDVQGVHNPPDLGQIVAPNVEINRYPLELGTTILGRPSPPLRINVRFDVMDLEGQEDTMHVRFGYDTGAGGTIPGFFQATLKGLDEFYNPLDAEISTKGDLLTQSPQPTWYEGPLTIIGGFEQGDLKADLGLEYAPFPDELGVRFAQDATGAHIAYEHDFAGDVDLAADLTLDAGLERTAVDARIERLPKQLAVDIADDPDGGGIAFASESDGRLADVDVRVRGPIAGDVYDAHLAIEELPTQMRASWSLPANGAIDASFDSSGQGIGAIEADITNSSGDPAGLPAFAFTEQQVLAVHHNAATDGLRVGGRLERIRTASISSTPDGEIDAQVDIGDGELPLEIDGFLDLRGDGDPLIDASATVSPLPGDIGVTIVPAGADPQVDPMTITYRAAEAPDIDGSVKVRQAGAPSGVCGTAGVLCGDLRIRHVPTEVETRIGDFTNEDGKQEARIEVDAQGVDKPDLFADVTIGPALDEPGGRPLVARAEVLALTEIARIRTIEGADDTLERAEFHTCDFLYADDVCAPGTEDRIGALEFAISNFLPTARPADLPPAYAATPNFATITARGRDGGSSVDFEATGRMSDIREVTYVNNGAFGVRTDIGGGKPLAAIVDIDGIRFEEAPDPADTEFYDLTGDVLIDPLPRTMAFCLNASGQQIVSPTSTITAPCQQANPFDPGGDPLGKSPLSVAYDGSTPFDVTADAELHATGTAGSDDRDDQRIRGHLEVLNIPATIRAHILNPDDVGGTGPMLVDIDAPLADTGAEQVDVVVGAQVLDADLQCQDPRVPDAGHKALCASGRIENLPTHLSLSYDPKSASDNFVLDSDGPEQLDLKELSVSSVERNDDGDDDPTNDRAKVLIAEGQVLGLPKRVEGTLSLPAPDDADAPVLVDLTATPPLATIEAEVRNFVAPDPIPDVPAQRVGLPAPDDEASFIQRGDAFKAKVRITDVKRVGFKNQVDANGTRLDTSVVNVDFGKDKNIRGYVDLDVDGTERVIGDVTLAQVPAGLQVCFRGPKSDETADLVAVNPTYCDTNPPEPSDPEAANPQKVQSALELRMNPDAPAGIELDVDAFVRHATSGGADVIAGRVDIDNIPNVVAGTFGDGQADFGGFQLDGTPDGIDRISAHAASFDIPDDGWTPATRPYEPRFVSRAPFPAPEPAIQHVAVRADDADFELRTRIGEVEPSPVPASSLHRVRLGSAPCARPEPVDYGNGELPDYGPRPDFPYLPTDDGTTHTCVRADFEPVGPNQVDPLDLSAIIDKGGQRVALHDAGLTDIPEFFQLNLADAEPLQEIAGQPRMRPHCVGTGETQPANCVAPMVRVDTPGNSTLFGVVEVGRLSDVALLETVQAREELPAPVEPQGWGSENGVRARIGQLPDRSVIKAGIRIPIPASFTVDQVQSWGLSSQASQDTFYDASDLHFRYAARDSAGSTIANLGRLSALLHSFVDGGQILISDDDPSLGFEVPGELGLEVYSRDFSGKGRSFVQIDGRNSAQDFDMRARLLGGAGEDAISRVDAQIRNVPALSSLAYSPSAAPTFRLRAEIMGEGKAPPDPDSSPDDEGGPPPKEDECSPLLCVQTQVRLDTVNAQFDFEPTTGQPARLIEAAIRTDGAKNGVEVRGFSSVDGGDPARFLAGAQLSVDPINIFLHAGIPFLGSLDFVMMADLDAAVSLGGDFEGFNVGATDIDDVWNQAIFGAAPDLVGPGTTAFTLKQNLLHLKMANGDGGSSRLGPIDFNVDIMHGEAWALFVKLIGIDFLPPYSTLRIPMLNCNAGGILPGGLNSVEVPPNGSKNVVAWPFFPFPAGNIHFSGVLAPLADLAGSLGGPFFCLVDTDQELMFDGSNTKVHPADPLGVVVTGSPVPGAMENPDDLPVPVTPPPSPAELADFTLPGNLAMCGTFTFDDVHIPAGRTLSVATAYSNLDIRGLTDAADDAFPAACPSGATLRELQLVAAGTVTVDGSIDASAISTTGTNASGNGGAGHGVFSLSPFVITGFGGNGGNSGAGGVPFGDLTNPLGADPGPAGSTTATAHGAGGTAGTGGAVIKILADVLDVNAGGAVVADGSGGGSVGAPADCFVQDTDPGTDGDQSKPNEGRAGGGGAAGGGIVISVADLQNSGTIAARGGSGGAGSAGGGGGGGGGIVKVTTALRSGALPAVGGGAGGGSICPSDFAAGGGGQAGYVDLRQAPRSRVDISGLDGFGFWHSTQGGAPLSLPYEAAASPVPVDDYQVALCHTVLSPSLLQDDQDLASQLLSFPGGLATPTLPHWNGFFLEDGNACGAGVGLPDPLITQPALLTVDTVDASRNTGTLTVDNPLPLPSLEEGYHGFWTILWKTDTAGNSCFDPSDFGGGLAGIQYDEAHCFPEAVPTSPDVVLGIDNTNPNVHDLAVNGTTITDNTGTVVGPQPMPVPSTSIQLSWIDDDNLSLVTGRQCTPNAATNDDLNDCTSGGTLEVASGDGTKTIGIKVTDAAGNTDTFTVDLLLDTTVPSSQGEIVAGSATPGSNGWYLSSPSFRLHDLDDGAGSGPGTPPFEYQIDEGDVRPCATDPCDIDGSPGHDLPGIGRHQLHWTAIDAVGNKLAGDKRPVIGVKVDDELPLSELLTVPAAPNGANGWFSGATWVSFGAFDQPGASGFELQAGDPTETDPSIGGIFYAHDGGPLVRFDPLQPLRLHAGVNELCWFARDVAGNAEKARCRQLLVDEADPLAVPVTSGGALGDNGWLVASPTLSTQVGDSGAAGSGVAGDLGPTETLCGQRPLIADVAPSGTCISIDGAPFLPIEAAKAQFLLGEGRHDVKVFATDRAGRRSAIRTRLYQVDLSKPVVAARTIAPEPSRGRWFRAEPTVVLRAADGDRHASSVREIRYRVVDGTTSTCRPGTDSTVYTEPFTVSEGLHTVQYWGVDEAGIVGDCLTLPVAVDLTRPVPKASPNANIWVRLYLLGIPLTNQTTQLKWTLQENLSGAVGEKVNVEVIVYDVLGYPVRHLNAGQYLVTPGSTLSGSTTWDGRNDTLTGLVPLGTYYYRVVATDAAGNPAMSGESGSLIIVKAL